jgi:hypothetical protein
MSEAVSIRPEPIPGAPFDDLFASAQRATRASLRLLSVAVGWMLIAIGSVLALFPWHPGVPLLAVGVILVLRNSYRARRQFIHLQRRHPRFVFPVRRLIRREPEVLPVMWQQVLRVERLVLPGSWRRAATWRRRYLRRRGS